jgi:hypothetical protein
MKYSALHNMKNTCGNPKVAGYDAHQAMPPVIILFVSFLHKIRKFGNMGWDLSRLCFGLTPRQKFSFVNHSK